MQRKDIETVIQILAKGSVAHAFEQIAIGRGDDAHVALDRGVSADALELALLKHAQKLDLHFGRDLTDFVEEDRAAVRQLESSDASRDRPAEGAALMAEQLALDEPCWKGRAVDLNERLGLSRAGRVNRARN